MGWDDGSWCNNIGIRRASGRFFSSHQFNCVSGPPAGLSQRFTCLPQAIIDSAFPDLLPEIGRDAISCKNWYFS